MDNEKSFTNDIFSESDDDSEYEREDSNVTHETSPAIPKDVNSRTTNNSVFDSFKVLENLETVMLKKRRTNILPKSTDERYLGEDQHVEFQTTLKNVHKIISSLRNPEEVMASYSTGEANEVSAAVPARNQRFKYGRSRTILRGTEEDGANECVTDDLYQDSHIHVGSNNANVDSTSVIHVNQLKNLGEALRFEDDLDFLKGTPCNKNVLFSKLLSFALEIKNNFPLLGFAKRYKADQIWEWTFRISDPTDIPLCYLQLWIAKTFPLDKNDLRWSKINHLVIACSYINDEVHHPQSVSKFVSMNFKDFMKTEDYTCPKELALEIWGNVAELLGSEKTGRILELLEEPDIQVLNILEKYITPDSDMTFLRDCHAKMNKRMNDFIDVSAFIKILIKMTNNVSFLGILSNEEKSSLINLCLSSIIRKHACDERGDHIQDISIFQLGLILNLITEVQMRYDKELVDNVRMLLLKLEKQTFMCQLLQLTFVFIAKSNELQLNQDEIETLQASLEHLRDGTKNKNISIYEKATLGNNHLRRI